MTIGILNRELERFLCITANCNRFGWRALYGWGVIEFCFTFGECGWRFVTPSVDGDDLLSTITKEFDITTIINTHDMNSVMGIGESIIFISDGRKEWQGNKDTVISSRNKKLNDLVFASELFKKVKEAEIAEK